MSREEDREEIEAELGYRVRGEREVRLREWFSLREEGETPRQFDLLVKALRARKYWKTASPERKARAIAYRRRWALAHPEATAAAVAKCKRRRRKLRTPAFLREEAARKAKRKAELIARHAEAIFTCTRCGAQWCSALYVPLPKLFKPKYCGNACRGRACYERRKARLASIAGEGPAGGGR